MERKINKVVSTLAYDGWHLEKLRGIFAPAELICLKTGDTQELQRELPDADVVVWGGDFPEEYLETGKNLKWIHCEHSGINRSARPEIFRRGIILTGGAGRSGPVLAEHTFFLILSLIYRANLLHANKEKHVWDGGMYVDARGLYGKTVGIVGAGHTGCDTARLARACGMRVLAYQRTSEVPPVCADADETFYADREGDLYRLLGESDIIVLSVRLSDATYHLIDAAAIGQMKKSALLINICRGAVIDEAALIKALENREIAGFASDTFETEPLPADSPLWDMDQVVITPHCTPEMPDIRARSLEIIEENAARFRRGEDLINRVYPRDVYTR